LSPLLKNGFRAPGPNPTQPAGQPNPQQLCAAPVVDKTFYGFFRIVVDWQEARFPYLFDLTEPFWFGVVETALVIINCVKLRRARLVSGWVTFVGSVIPVFSQACRDHSALPFIRG